MPIDFRKPQYFKEFRFGSTLVWNVIKEIVIPTVVSGVSPLTLANAAAKEIRSLIQYGKCTIVNDEIYCNNGKLMAVHRSGLPSGYKLLEYIGGSGSQYVITDLYLASTDVVECEFRNSATTGYGAVYGVFKLGESSALYGNQTYYGYDAANNKVNTGISVNTEWHSVRHDFVNGTLTVDDTTVTFMPFEFVNSTQNAVLSRYYNDSYGYNWKGYVRKFKVTRGNEVVCDLLPAKNSNDVAGLYDLVSGTFYTATSGTLVAGDEVDDYELRVVGTPEVLTVTGKNLFDISAYDDERVWAGTSYKYIAIPLPNGTYTISWDKSKGGSFYWLVQVDGTKKGTSSTTDGDSWLWHNTNTSLQKETVTFTVTEGYVYFSCFFRDYFVQEFLPALQTVQIEKGSTATAYEPYVEPQTASVVNLFAVGDVKDEQNIISGVITHRTKTNITNGIITIQVLTEPITEQVQKQPLSTTEGTNTVLVEAEVNDISLKIEYYTVG